MSNDTYDQDLIDKIKREVTKIIQDSNAAVDSEITKASYYFMGVPGTGKTTTAQFIAEVLGLPFYMIDLSLTNPEDVYSAKENFQPEGPALMG